MLTIVLRLIDHFIFVSCFSDLRSQYRDENTLNRSCASPQAEGGQYKPLHPLPNLPLPRAESL